MWRARDGFRTGAHGSADRASRRAISTPITNAEKSMMVSLTFPLTVT
jgi:hypothetical protein